MNWTEIEIVVNNEFEDHITGILYTFDIDGINITDYRDFEEFKLTKPYWVIYDEDISIVKSDDITLKTYFKNDDNICSNISDLKDMLTNFEITNNTKVKLKINSNFKNEDWANEWKKYYKPVRIGRNFIIKPTWEKYNSLETDIVIQLDPGMAFGTGTHETTILCLEAIEKLSLDDKVVFDIGSGSGILSIGAIKMGAKHVESVDIDLLAVESTLFNAKLNEVENKIKIHHGSLFETLNSKADVVIANILPDVLVDLINNIDKYINSGGIFIGSGVIEAKYDIIEDALINNNFSIINIDKKRIGYV